MASAQARSTGAGASSRGEHRDVDAPFGRPSSNHGKSQEAESGVAPRRAKERNGIRVETLGARRPGVLDADGRCARAGHGFTTGRSHCRDVSERHPSRPSRGTIGCDNVGRRTRTSPRAALVSENVLQPGSSLADRIGEHASLGLPFGTQDSKRLASDSKASSSVATSRLSTHQDVRAIGPRSMSVSRRCCRPERASAASVLRRRELLRGRESASQANAVMVPTSVSK